MFERLAVVLVDRAYDPDGHLRSILGKSAAARLAAECTYGQHVRSVIREMDPDAVLVRLYEPSASSLRSLAIASLASPQTPILAILPNRSRSVFELTRKAIQAGANDVLLSPVQVSELDNALWNAKVAAERRRLAALDDPVILVQPEVFLTVSPKGGVGKSTLVVNLAAKLSSLTDETIVVTDLDPLSSSSAKMLGVECIPLQLLEESEDPSREDVRSILQRCGSHLSVVSASSTLGWEGRGINTQGALRLVGKLAKASDFIFIDTPPGGLEEVAPLIEAASLCFLLTTPDFNSIASVGTFLQAGQGIPFFEDKVKIVLNQDGLSGGADRSTIERALGRPIFWAVPHDSKAISAAGLGVPLVQSYPHSKAARSLADLLYVVTGYREPSRSLFQRVLRPLQRQHDNDIKVERSANDVTVETLVRKVGSSDKVTLVGTAGNHD